MRCHRVLLKKVVISEGVHNAEPVEQVVAQPSLKNYLRDKLEPSNKQGQTYDGENRGGFGTPPMCLLPPSIAILWFVGLGPNLEQIFWT
jgi:hypothetical protein